MARGTRRICLGVALLWPVPLLAHAKLVRSDPAAGAALATSPSQVRLVFSESPSLAFCSVSIVGARGDTVSLRHLHADPADSHTLIAELPPALGAGKYRVVWRVASRDGHPERGSFDFVVLETATAAGSAASPPSDSTSSDLTLAAEAPNMPSDSEPRTMAIGGALAFIAARWLSFLAMFIVIGVVTFRFGVLDRMGVGNADAFMQIASSNAAALGIVGSAGVLVAAALKLVRESADMPDVGLGSMLFGSTWGLSLLLQMVAAIGAAAAFRSAHGGSDTARANAWRGALVSAVVLALTQTLGGHAASGDRSFLSVPADFIHIAAGSAWLGTLAVIVIVGISAALKSPDTTRPGERVASMINLFSPLALTCGAVVVTTGLVASLINLPTLDALWTTPYGVALLLKLVFVAMLFGAGAWNWRRMKPRLTGDDAVVSLRSTATFELLLASIVLGITAILVALELP